MKKTFMKNKLRPLWLQHQLDPQAQIVQILLQQLRVAEVETNKRLLALSGGAFLSLILRTTQKRLRDKAMAEHAKYLERIAGDKKKEMQARRIALEGRRQTLVEKNLLAAENERIRAEQAR